MAEIDLARFCEPEAPAYHDSVLNRRILDRNRWAHTGSGAAAREHP